MPTQSLFYTLVDSPLGDVVIAADEQGIRHIVLPSQDGQARAVQSEWQRNDARLQLARQQLSEYFGGQRRSFELPLAPVGTDFQRRVWRELAAIPYGTYTTYAGIAGRIGRPLAARAVGAANRTNPLPIVIPCHRVIGHSGLLTGFAGGIETKRRLLAIEGIETTPTHIIVPEARQVILDIKAAATG